MVARRHKLIAHLACAEPQKNPAKTLDQRMLSFVDPIGQLLTDGFHIVAIHNRGATVSAAATAFYAKVPKGGVRNNIDNSRCDPDNVVWRMSVEYDD